LSVFSTNEFSLESNDSRGDSISVLLNPNVRQTLEAILSKESHEFGFVILAPNGLEIVEFDPHKIRGTGDSKSIWVGLFTSGSTGNPKLHFHNLPTLSRGVNPQHEGKVWGMLYQPNRMAGIQVILQAVASQAKIVEPHYGASLEEMVDEFIEAGVDSLSATPSRWRMILSTANHKNMHLKYIALGGEISNQRILDDLRKSFPEAQIRHIFATTETGPVFSVGDGLAGFPASNLGRALTSGRTISVEEGQLTVKWEDRETGDAKEFKTGDMVDVVDNRVLFVGRADDLVNVGGNKIALHQVEEALLTIAQVDECLAYAIPNPFLGALIGVEIKWKKSPLTDAELKANLIELLPKHAIPAVIKAVDEITLSSAFKKVRKK
jgi:acyl-coenzyme A synthetase/AMP-(fatty) acid ligase